MLREIAQRAPLISGESRPAWNSKVSEDIVAGTLDIACHTFPVSAPGLSSPRFVLATTSSSPAAIIRRLTRSLAIGQINVALAVSDIFRLHRPDAIVLPLANGLRSLTDKECDPASSNSDVYEQMFAIRL